MLTATFLTLAADTAPAATGFLGALDALIPVAVTAVATLLVPFLTRLSKKAKADLEAAQSAQAAKAMDYIWNFVAHQAAQVAQVDIPEIAEQYEKGDITSVEQLRRELEARGERVVTQTLDYMRANGIRVGSYNSHADEHAKVNQMVRAAAKSTSPFAGKSATQAIADGDTRTFLLQNGPELTKIYLQQQAATRAADGDTQLVHS